jgi:hypothetical protein
MHTRTGRCGTMSRSGCDLRTLLEPIRMKLVRLLLPLLLLGSSVAVCARWTASRGTSDASVLPASQPVVASTPEEAPEHPLIPALRLAQQAVTDIEKNIQDYTATLVKRESSNGKVGEQQTIKVKVRHQPFSVYVGVLAPPSYKGDEAIYVEGKNDGKLWGHTTGVTGMLVGTVSLKPDSVLAMQGQRYPMTEIGILNLTRRLVQVGDQDLQHDECEVRFLRDQKRQDRPCMVIEVMHPVRRSYFRFHLARIFIDDQLQLPIRYESYDWPARDGEPPPLLEEYEYFDLKLNCRLTDADFDPKNSEYQFP